MTKNALTIFGLSALIFGVVLICLLLFAPHLFHSGAPPTLTTDENQHFAQVAERLAGQAREAASRARLEEIERELQREYRSLRSPSDLAIMASNDCSLAINMRKSELLEARQP